MNIEILEKNYIIIAEKIVKIFMEIYEPVDFEINSINIEREIYDLSMSYSKIFFFENRAFLNDISRKKLESIILSGFKISERGVKKINDIDMFAHCIKLNVINKLSAEDILLI